MDEYSTRKIHTDAAFDEYYSENDELYDPNEGTPVDFEEIEYKEHTKGGHNDNFGQPQNNSWAAHQQDPAVPNSGRSGKAIGVIERNSGIQMWSTQLSSDWDFNHSLDYCNSSDFPSADWQANNNRAGVSAKNVRSEIFLYSTNQQMIQIFQMAKKAIAAPQSASDIQAGKVTSVMRRKGYNKVSESRSAVHEQRMK